MSDPLASARARRQVRRAMAHAERRAALVAVRALGRELGLLRALGVLGEVVRARALREPFASLGPPDSLREELSRAQLGPLVVLVRAVRRRAGAEAAMRVGRAVAHAGAMHFLERMIPDHDADTWAARAPELGEELLGRFFNATGSVRVGDGQASIDVTACQFVALLERIGERELAPLMCEADLDFFDGQRRAIRLERSHTLAEGADCCDFALRLDRRSR